MSGWRGRGPKKAAGAARGKKRLAPLSLFVCRYLGRHDAARGDGHRPAGQRGGSHPGGGGSEDTLHGGEGGARGGGVRRAESNLWSERAEGREGATPRPSPKFFQSRGRGGEGGGGTLTAQDAPWAPTPKPRRCLVCLHTQRRQQRGKQKRRGAGAARGSERKGHTPSHQAPRALGPPPTLSIKKTNTLRVRARARGGGGLSPHGPGRPGSGPGSGSVRRRRRAVAAAAAPGFGARRRHHHPRSRPAGWPRRLRRHHRRPGA